MDDVEEQVEAINCDLKSLARLYFRGTGRDYELYQCMFFYVEDALGACIYNLRHYPYTAGRAQQFIVHMACFEARLAHHLPDRRSRESIPSSLRTLVERFDLLHSAIRDRFRSDAHAAASHE